MRDLFALAVAVVLFPAPAFAEFEEHPPGQLRVDFGRSDITPPSGAIMTGPRLDRSVGADDLLHASTLVAQNGDRTVAIVGVDLVKIRRDLADAAIAQAARRTGIDRDAVMICPSHNHSSPFIPMGGPNNKDYLATLPGLIADSIEQAHRTMQPARMLLGRSLVYEGHHNRRVVSKADGLSLNTWLTKLNDLEQTPQILGTEGPIDPELWVARFDALDGRVLGTLVNFTCHPSLHDRIRLKTLSADFPGVIAEHMADAYGPEVVTVFTQGAAGDINQQHVSSPSWISSVATPILRSKTGQRRTLAKPVPPGCHSRLRSLRGWRQWDSRNLVVSTHGVGHVASNPSSFGSPRVECRVRGRFLFTCSAQCDLQVWHFVVEMNGQRLGPLCFDERACGTGLVRPRFFPTVRHRIRSENCRKERKSSSFLIVPDQGRRVLSIFPKQHAVIRVIESRFDGRRPIGHHESPSYQDEREAVAMATT